MNNSVRYGGNLGSADTNREPSPNLWKNADIASAIEQGRGVFFRDDFLDLPKAPTLTTEIAYGRYKAYATVSDTIDIKGSSMSSEQGGGIVTFSAAANNDGMSIATNGPFAFITGLTTNSGRLVFEARIALSTILANTLGFFLGLAEVDQWTLSATVPFNAASASLNNSAAAVGFFKDEASSPANIHSAYSDRATSFTDVNAAIGAAVANTWVKLGIDYDPTRTTDCVKFSVNGIFDATYVSRTTLTGTTNLKANALGLIFANIIDTGGAAAKSYLDWWQVWQDLPTV